jgi:hypothetical protein
MGHGRMAYFEQTENKKTAGLSADTQGSGFPVDETLETHFAR